MTNNWIRTYHGYRLDPLAPEPEAICIGDIAHALSNICRFTGHPIKFYSVAQHSVLVARYIQMAGFTGVAVLAGLLHDASEAYLSDIATPVKQRIPGYKKSEIVLQEMIEKLFGVSDVNPEIIHKADLILLATEARDLMGDPQDWDSLELVRPLNEKITPWLPDQAKDEFLNMFFALKSYGEKL